MISFNQIILPLTLVLAFLAVVALVQGAVSAFLGSHARTRRVNRRMTLLHQGLPGREVYDTLIHRHAAPTIGGQRVHNLFNRATVFLGQAGLAMAPQTLLAYAAGGGGALWIVATLATRAMGAGGGAAEATMSLFGAFTASGLGVWMWVSNKRNRRLRKLEDQLPLALDIVVRAIRAGHPVISAVQLVTEEMGDPIGTEFGIIVDETTYGFEFREALGNFARRTGSEDAHFFAVSVGIQSETGGNLAEILGNLTSVIRGRATLGKRIKSLGSEGRMSATILSILPVFLISAICISQPQFYTGKFADPIFWPVVGAILVVYGVGQYAMHRIVDFKY